MMVPATPTVDSRTADDIAASAPASAWTQFTSMARCSLTRRSIHATELQREIRLTSTGAKAHEPVTSPGSTADKAVSLTVARHTGGAPAQHP